MGSLAEWASEHGFPAITGLITSESDYVPEKAFFAYYGKDEITGLRWWLGEIAKAKTFDWSGALQGQPVVRRSPPKDSAAKGEDIPSKPAATLRLRDIAQSDSRFFLKSEWGPLSDFWPVVAFSPISLKTKIQRQYRSASDFIVYTGTKGEDTAEEAHRGRLLSLVRIDKTRTYDTRNVVPAASWAWANKKHPGRWPYAFKVLQGWSFVDRPPSTHVIPEAYSRIGQYPNKGSVLQIEGPGLEVLLELKFLQFS